MSATKAQPEPAPPGSKGLSEMVSVQAWEPVEPAGRQAALFHLKPARGAQVWEPLPDLKVRREQPVAAVPAKKAMVCSKVCFVLARHAQG